VPCPNLKYAVNAGIEDSFVKIRLNRDVRFAKESGMVGQIPKQGMSERARYPAYNTACHDFTSSYPEMDL
jgi:hypothetical protein